MAKTKSYRPISHTPIKGISTNTIQCNPEMFAMWLNDMAELLNYTNEISVGLHNEFLEVRKKLDCALVDIKELKELLSDENKNKNRHEARISFLERQLAGSGGMITVVEGKLDNLLNRLPGALADLPEDWQFAGGSPAVISKFMGNSDGSFKEVQDNLAGIMSLLPKNLTELKAIDGWKLVGGVKRDYMTDTMRRVDDDNIYHMIMALDNKKQDKEV